MGKAENKILAGSDWKDNNSTIGHPCTISSGSDTLPGCARDSACHI